jgi:sugar lactone lactonase YvrE
VTPGGIITTVAGNGIAGYSGDGGAATSAQLYHPYGVAVDAAGNLYIADTSNHRIRRVTPGGIITTVAGNGIAGYSGDGGAATSAQLSYPDGMAVDAAGNLYIADNGNRRIRRVTPGGIISTVAGNGTRGYSGDGGAAASAQLYAPSGVAVDAVGNLYIADAGNNRIRRVTPGGIITTVAGNGIAGYSGDGGAATSAQVNYPWGVAVAAQGRIFFSQGLASGAGAVRLLTPTSSACTYTATPTTLLSASSGGTLSLTISTSADCAWTLTGLPSWVSASSTSGSGPATVTLTVGPNPGPARSANFTAADVSISVNQAGATAVCIYSISPGGQVFSSASGTGSIEVTTQPGCTWTASSGLAWASIASGGSGTGSGTVTYRVQSNASGSARSGTLTIAGRPFNLEQLGVPPLISGGSMAHIASGGGWKTTFTLVNNGATTAQFRLVFTSDSGTELTLPLSFPQTGVGPVLASTLERSLQPGATLIVECEGPVTQDTQQGAAQLLSNGQVSGFAVFRQRNGEAEQEAVVPLETRTAAAYVLPFDNTMGVQTGVAVANLAAHGGASVVVIRDDAGAEVMSTSLNLVARGHTAFVLSSMYAPAAQRRGTIEFRPPAGGQISVLGLRFDPRGSFTTIPVLVR